MRLLSARRFIRFGKAKPVVHPPSPGVVLLVPEEGAGETGARLSGFRRFADQYLRIDIAERLARLAHEKIGKGEAFTSQHPQVVSLGLNGEAFGQLMRSAGFRPAPEPLKGEANWAFRGRPRPPKARPAHGGLHFSGLAQLLGRHG